MLASLLNLSFIKGIVKVKQGKAPFEKGALNAKGQIN